MKYLSDNSDEHGKPSTARGHSGILIPRAWKDTHLPTGFRHPPCLLKSPGPNLPLFAAKAKIFQEEGLID